MDYANATVPSPAAMRETQIPQQLDALQRSLDELEKAVTSIIVRLSKVCTPANPNSIGEAKESKVLCEYAENISNKVKFVNVIINDLSALERRLEV